MVSVRKRKMARSSTKKVSRKVKDKKRDINIHSNPIVAANWDKKLTLTQNYAKMGLASKLNKPAGGSEKPLAVELKKAAAAKKSVVKDTTDPNLIPEGEARIVRDEDGKVLEIIYGKANAASLAPVKEDTDIVKQFKANALKHSQIKKERVQSDREVEWIEKLYNKYGDDYEKMKWDKKLNIFQQSPGDLRRRVMKWKKSKNIE